MASPLRTQTVTRSAKNSDGLSRHLQPIISPGTTERMMEYMVMQVVSILMQNDMLANDEHTNAACEVWQGSFLFHDGNHVVRCQ